MWKRDELGFPSFWQPQAAGCGGLDLLSLFSPIATPTKSRARPSFARQFSLRVPGCGPCAALFRAAHFRRSLSKFAPSAGRRICGCCRLCSRAGELVFGPPHWCTLYFSLSSRGRRRTRESSWPVTGNDWFRLRVAAAGMLIYPHPKSLPTGLP